jgi:hypothetical protein
MMMHIRPGWPSLCRYLAGGADTRFGARRRFEIYVCTAAERSYALEVGLASVWLYLSASPHRPPVGASLVVKCLPLSCHQTSPCSRSKFKSSVAKFALHLP